MARKPQKKSGTTTRRRKVVELPTAKAAKPAKPAKAVKPSNGSSETAKTWSLGDKIVMDNEVDRATIRVAEEQLTDAQTRLGRLRDDYLAQEQQMREQMGTLREEYHVLVKTLGRKYEVPIDAPDQSWQFRPDEFSYTRMR